MKRLMEGDMIRVIAPSGCVKENDRVLLEKAKNIFENELGLKVSFGEYIFENKGGSGTASINSRIKDFHNAFKDDNVKLIICRTGGFYGNQLLRYIDRELIKANPKLFCGYSDITIFLNSIYRKTGLVVYHGPSFKKFGKLNEYTRMYTINSFRNKLFEGYNNANIESSKQRYDTGTFYENKNNKVINNIGQVVINPGKAKGIVVGGNICTLNLLQGTEYMPSLKNSILFLEDDDLWQSYARGEFDRNFESLALLSDFSGVQGIVLGRFQINSRVSIDDVKNIIVNKPYLKEIPIIANIDFGHTLPVITFPVGGTCRIDTSRSQDEILEIE